jgi:addiction module RelE/StbE family toxin
MKLKIQASARSDLDNIFDWISQDSPSNAAAVIERILDAMDNAIVLFPSMGRKGQVVGTREWMVQNSPYLIIYEIDEESEVVLILSVIHGARDR